MYLCIGILNFRTLFPGLVPPFLHPFDKQRVGARAGWSPLPAGFGKLSLHGSSQFARDKSTNQIAHIGGEMTPTWCLFTMSAVFPTSREKRQSIVHSLYHSQRGAVGPFLPHVYQTPLRNCLKQRFVKDAVKWRVHKSLSPFTRRVTAVEWHPTYHNTVAFASHGGDIHLWNYDDRSRDLNIRGLGYGFGCITAMKFHPENPRFIYTTSVDGRFCLQDFEGRQSSVFLDTQDISYWWCSMDICRPHNVLFVGGNTGKAVVLDSSGEVVCEYKKLHRGKIKYCEFCPTRCWLVATASVDHTVNLWDIRMLRSHSGKQFEPISSLVHGAPVNSALFDPHFGSRLLTTAQNSELRVYDACSNWETPTAVISHPHRHFQHMTDIIAMWHPIHDGLCVVGRYPGKEDSDQSRCVDLIDVVHGKRVSSFFSPTLKGVIVLNKFSRCGSCLASGMGYQCLLWQPEEEVLRLARKKYSQSQLNGEPGWEKQPRRAKKRRRESDDKAKKLNEQIKRKKKL